MKNSVWRTVHCSGMLRQIKVNIEHCRNLMIFVELCRDLKNRTEMWRKVQKFEPDQRKWVSMKTRLHVWKDQNNYLDFAACKAVYAAGSVVEHFKHMKLIKVKLKTYIEINLMKPAVLLRSNKPDWDPWFAVLVQLEGGNRTYESISTYRRAYREIRW